MHYELCKKNVTFPFSNSLQNSTLETSSFILIIILLRIESLVKDKYVIQIRIFNSYIIKKYL